MPPSDAFQGQVSPKNKALLFRFRVWLNDASFWLHNSRPTVRVALGGLQAGNPRCVIQAFGGLLVDRKSI